MGLIGYGYWGPNLARNFHELAESKLAACCDTDDSRLAAAQALYPHLRTATRPEEVWKDKTIEAVAIATPAQTHFELAKSALEAGKHVLVEKPLTLQSGEAQALIELAQDRGLVLMVGHTYEYNPAVLKIKELMDAGTLGQIHYVHSIRVNLGRVLPDLNVLWSIAPHDISILCHLFEAAPLEVSATGANYLHHAVEDVVFVNLWFAEGVTGHVHASWLDPVKVRKMTIVGSKKMVVFDDIENEGKVRIYDKGVLKMGAGPVFGEYQYRLHSGDISIPRIDLSEPLREECAHFIGCVREGKKPRTDGENGLRVVRVLEAAQGSMERRGVPVEVSS